MDSNWQKLDAELQIIYSNYLEIQQKGIANVTWIHPSIRNTFQLSVKMDYKGDLEAIREAGFEVTQIIDDYSVRGKLLLANLERIVSYEQVIKLSFGRRAKIMLDTSVKSINAGDNSGAGSGSQVWTFNPSTKQFAGQTGKGVVVGIIDTGIDYNHPVFFEKDSPKTTRIRRIWDQGVKPHDSVQSPQANYLEGNDRYGAEYTDVMINKVLRGEADSSTIKHKDCSGHGTHVASISAGDGRVKKPSEKDSQYRYIGVAPEADIVFVKILYLFEEPKTPPTAGDPTGTAIGYDQQFYDAVTYILKVAELDLGNKPVVINYSVGDSHGPHDGFAEQERWLTQKFGQANGKGLFVAAAGNEAGDDIYAIATIPASGEMTIPLTLYDTRTIKTSFDKCRTEDDTNEIGLDIWYANFQPNPANITPHLKLPGKPELPGLALSATIQHGDVGDNDLFYYVHIHTTETITRPAFSGDPQMSVMRNNIILGLKPNIRGSFKTGSYKMRLTGTVGAKLHMWASITYTKHGKYGLRFPVTDDTDGLDVKRGSHEQHLVIQPASAKNILAVAAYDDIDGVIADFSSPGPLLDYSPSGVPYISKPDVAAPGVRIMAAESNHTTPPVKPGCCQDSAPPNFVNKSGTSMASPHVAGLAALLLQKKPSLTTTELINLIKTHVATASTPLDPNQFGTGQVDAKKAIDHVI